MINHLCQFGKTRSIVLSITYKMKVASEDEEMSEYGDDWDDNDPSIWQDLNDETTVTIDERKSSTGSTSSEASFYVEFSYMLQINRKRTFLT